MPINRMPTRDFIQVKQRNRLDSLVTDVTPNAPPETIAKVRAIIKPEFEAHPEEFDASDVERMMSSDWTVTRFLLRKRDDVDEAAKMILACSRWRHRLGMPQWKDEQFPEEFYHVGCVFPYVEDQLGNQMIYIRAKLYDKKLASIQDLFRRFILHIANRVDNERDGRGWSIVFDCAGSGYSNLDINMILFLINEVVPNLPKGLNYVLIYELPWLLGKIVNTAIACLPADYKRLVKNGTSKDIHSWVAQEALPDFMGGTCQVNYRRAPKGARTFREMAQELRLAEKELAIIYKMYQPYLDEANEALAARKQASRGIRRHSSVLDLWHWMKNKMGDGGGAGGSSTGGQVDNKPADTSAGGDKEMAGKGALRKISLTGTTKNKQDGPAAKLEAIKDETGGQ